MKKRIRSYCKTMDQLLHDMPSETDWNAIKQEHLQQLAFFQHERLIHLIVTMTFAILTLLSASATWIAKVPFLFLLTTALLILLIFYIGHYYVLENNVQHMYVQYDQLQRLSSGISILPESL